MKKAFGIFLMFISAFSVYAESVNLRTGNVFDAVEVNEILSIGYGSKVSEIQFESRSPKITTIALEGTAFIEDYSFIGKCKELEVLIMNTVSLKNMDFLKSCKKLKVLALDSVSVEKLPDFRELENAEYIAFSNCNLTDIREFTHHAEKLRCIDLRYNKISMLPQLEKKDRAMYFLSGNEIMASNCKNFIFDEDIYQKLPEEFRQYVR